MAKIDIYDNSAQILWKDRRRYFGIPCSFTRYSIIRRDGEYTKLVNINGLLSTKTEEVNMFRIDDFTITQTLFDKIFGVGTITVYCKDASCDTLVLHKIKDPFKVRELLNKLVLEDRRRVNLHYSEMQR